MAGTINAFNRWQQRLVGARGGSVQGILRKSVREGGSYQPLFVIPGRHEAMSFDVQLHIREP